MGLKARPDSRVRRPMARVFGLVLSLVITLLLGCRSAGTPVASERPGAFEQDQQPADGMFAYTAPGELPQLVVLDAEGVPSNLPLKHTDVAAQVRGHVAQVRVSQQFHNDRAEPIEVTYTFPLPENSAVDSMRMVIGERVIEGEIQRRAEARDTYEQARADGYTSALLEQERPNIFTQSLANVPPGETIAVEITYLQTLSQDAGTYEFVFPMVVGPRFIPPGDAVSDAERIMPPVLGEGTRTGHDLSLALEVQLGSSIEHWDAPTHTVIGEATPQGFTAALADANTIPNRDFVIRWSAAGASTQARLLLGPKDAAGMGHFALIVQPPALDLDELVGRREMIFVVDRSGSMSGVPLALAKQTVREALTRLRPVDTFDVIGFESGTERLFGTPRPANQDNLVRAERFIDGLEAGGGTMMEGAVEVALKPALTEGRNRYVLFLTDGYIGDENQIFAAAASLVRRAERGDLRARVFGVGIGSAPNSHLLAGLSKAGQGVSLQVGNREDPRPAVDRWSGYVDHPIAHDLEIDWAGLEVVDRYPSTLPDLFASHAVVVLGRYSGEVSGDVTLEAELAEGHTVTIPVVVATSEVDDRILATLWAREKIADVTAAGWDDALDDAEVEQTITRVGLEFGLVTAFTSFVAVDRSRVVGQGDPLHVTQPVEVPEDVDPIQAGSMILPIGSDTSRDFTAVVDLAPTASRDAAGISLAGTSGAESRYIVERAPVRNPSYGTVATSMRTEFVESPSDVGLGSWPSQAKLSLASLHASEGANARALRRSITRQSLKFEACYEQKIGHVGKRRMTLRLRFDSNGTLEAIDIVDGTLGTADADGCIEAVLHSIDWQGLPTSRTVVDIELGLRMR
jgi:Ca-activated chloride channel family protein